MLLTCANPQCASQFDYRQGQLLRAPRPDDIEAEGEIKHFWLCGACTSRYFLEYRPGQGVLMLPRPLGPAKPKRGVAA